MSRYQLAQIDFARMLDAIESPVMTSFVANLVADAFTSKQAFAL